LISKRAKDDLIDDYDHAVDYVGRAAVYLEEASVMISAAGPEFTRISSKLIDNANNVYAEIHRVRNQLHEVKHDDDRTF
jgi:hypothetical protein